MSIHPSEISKMMLEASTSPSQNANSNTASSSRRSSSNSASSAVACPSVISSSSSHCDDNHINSNTTGALAHTLKTLRNKSGASNVQDSSRLEARMVAQWNASSSSLPCDGGDDELPEPPRRPLSAYNFFFKAERARILGIKAEEQDAEAAAAAEEAELGPGGKKRKHRKTPGMIGFRQLANHVGERWRNLSSEEKVPYQAKFEADRARYKKEMKEWEDAQRRRTIRQNKVMMARIKMQKELSANNQQQQHQMFQMQRKHQLQQHAIPTQDVTSMTFSSSVVPMMPSQMSGTGSGVGGGGDNDQFHRSSRTSAVLARAISIIHEGKGESFLAQDDACLDNTEPGGDQRQWGRNSHDLPDVAPSGLFGAVPSKDFYQEMKIRNMMNMTKRNREGGTKKQGFNDTLAQISRGVLKNWGAQPQNEVDMQSQQATYLQEEQVNQINSFGPGPSPKRRNAVASHFDIADSFCEDKEEPEPYTMEEAKLHQKFQCWQGEAQQQQQRVQESRQHEEGHVQGLSLQQLEHLQGLGLGQQQDFHQLEPQDYHQQEQGSMQQQQHVEVRKPFTPRFAPSLGFGKGSLFPGPVSLPVYNQEMSPSVNHLENELGHLMGDDLIQSLAGGI